MAIRNRQPEGWGGLDGSLPPPRLQSDQHCRQTRSIPVPDQPSTQIVTGCPPAMVLRQLILTEARGPRRGDSVFSVPLC